MYLTVEEVRELRRRVLAKKHKQRDDTTHRLDMQIFKLRSEINSRKIWEEIMIEKNMETVKQISALQHDREKTLAHIADRVKEKEKEAELLEERLKLVEAQITELQGPTQPVNGCREYQKEMRDREAYRRQERNLRQEDTRSVDLLGPKASPSTPGEQKLIIDKYIQVEEKLVGAIFGPRGQHIMEIQQNSGATVDISKKGVYHPETRNRVITIKGPMGAVESAEYLITQKINQERVKRDRSRRLFNIQNNTNSNDDHHLCYG